jgi:acetyl/propionyl-CoA carboxylase alpha subunit
MTDIRWTGRIGRVERELLDEARALLSAFVQSGTGVIEVKTADSEIRISRSVQQARTDCLAATTPHVGTVHSIAPQGTRLEAGDTVATLLVLGEPRPVKASRGGTVERVFVRPGDLLEFGQRFSLIGHADER